MVLVRCFTEVEDEDMLDAYIIDAIRREEEQRERESSRPRVHLEIPVYREPIPSTFDEESRYEEPAEQESVIIIPINPNKRPSEDAA